MSYDATFDVRPDDNRVFEFDCDKMDELQGGDTIVSAAVTGAGLTIGTPAIVASKNSSTAARQVNCQIRGFTVSTNYDVKLDVTTSSGAVKDYLLQFKCGT